VTGVNQKHHLRASHIKPWARSSDVEKLHACNGLLLAPHIDHLFDHGFITFDDKGEVIESPKLELEVIEKWGLDRRVPAKTFNSDQKFFLEFHRTQVFRSS
jgi:predicted restriction endonuclease